MWWGYSPALDILEEYESGYSESLLGWSLACFWRSSSVHFPGVGPAPPERGGAEPPGAWGGGDGDGGEGDGALHVLAVGCADGRHQLLTAARRWRRAAPLRRCRLTWHVAEALPELYARQLLLASVATAPAQELGPRERARLYLELYGNTLLRARSAAFLAKRGEQLARVVADEDLLRAQLAASLELMRHRERDHVQDACLLWRAPAGLSMAALWDTRVRRHLGTRYDSRSGAFDWDYHMRLRELCGDHVGLREYKHWRETGVAFTWLETECSLPNASLLSWVERAHGDIRHRGYCGDIESGPFPAFGHDTSHDPSFDKTCNGLRAKSSKDIAERNLQRLFHELQNESPYEPPEEQCDRTPCITELPAARDDWVGADESLVVDKQTEDDGEDCEDADGEPAGEEGRVGGQGTRGGRGAPPLRCNPPPRTLTLFLPQDALIKYPQKPKLKHTFDVIVFAQGLSHWLKPEVVSMARPGALVLVEGKRWVVSTRRQAVMDHAQQLAERAKAAGCAPLRTFDPLQDDYAVFRVHSDEPPGESSLPVQQPAPELPTSPLSKSGPLLPALSSGHDFSKPSAAPATDTESAS